MAMTIENFVNVHTAATMVSKSQGRFDFPSREVPTTSQGTDTWQSEDYSLNSP